MPDLPPEQEKSLSQLYSCYMSRRRAESFKRESGAKRDPTSAPGSHQSLSDEGEGG